MLVWRFIICNIYIALCLPGNSGFRRSLMTFGNNLDLDEAPQKVGTRLQSKLFYSKIIFNNILWMETIHFCIIRKKNIYKKIKIACEEFKTSLNQCKRPSLELCGVTTVTTSDLCIHSIPNLHFLYGKRPSTRHGRSFTYAAQWKSEPAARKQTIIR